jgi:AraC-like DNA-binding protein
VYQERPSRIAGGFVWTSTVAADGTRVLPDGCMDLIWGDDGVFVAGPDTTAFRFEGVPGSRLTGLRFAPGFGPRVLGVPAYELKNSRVPLDAVWPACQVRELVDRLGATDDPGRVLEDVASEAARRIDADHGLIEAVVVGARVGQNVTAIADLVALSTRQLQRRCVDAFGYGARTLARILRMVHALELARSGRAFSAVAADAGYADQAHMARDVRALAGVTLGQLVGASGSGANRSTELPSGSWTTA